MSSVLWDKDNLIQRVGSNIEELGHVRHEENSNQYVLWLKDTRGVFGSNKGYIRGDTFPSMEDAKQKRCFLHVCVAFPLHVVDRPARRGK